MVPMDMKVIAFKSNVLSVRMDSLFSKVREGATLVGVDEWIRVTAIWSDIWRIYFIKYLTLYACCVSLCAGLQPRATIVYFAYEYPQKAQHSGRITHYYNSHLTNAFVTDNTKMNTCTSLSIQFQIAIQAMSFLIFRINQLSQIRKW